jgi:serine/threonine protein kinase
MEGGKKYGTGAKGYLIDIFENKKNDNDKEFFYKDDTNYKYNFIYTSTDEQKIEGQQEQQQEVQEQQQEVQQKTDEQIKDIFDNLREKPDNFLIKVYEKKEYYEAEKNLTIQLINDKIIYDYIPYNNNNNKKKIIGVEKIIGNKKIYGLFKRKCDLTLDKFIIIDKSNYNILCNIEKKKSTESTEKCCDNSDNIYKLRDVMKDILTDIINLQQKNYVHCDIKADNIMICDGAAKLIDWDLAIKNVSDNYYNIYKICENRYHGSGTHQSPLITKYLYKFCGKSAIGQKLIMSASETLKKRNIPPDHNKINKNTENYFKKILDINREKNIIIENLIKYHIDLYSVSHVLYELCGNQKIYKKISNKYPEFNKFISILQNTIEVDKEKNFIYYNINENEEKNNLDDLLNKIYDNLYIIDKQKIYNDLDLYKHKYMKYKQKYLELKNNN